MTTRQRKAKGRVVYKFRLPVPLDPGPLRAPVDPFCAGLDVYSADVVLGAIRPCTCEPGV